MKKQVISILFAIILIFALKNTCHAASAEISCNTSATIGEEITISANVTGVMWNLELKVNGETIAKNSELENYESNKTVTFSGKYTPTAEGSLNVTLTGTVTEFSDGSTLRNFGAKTITVKAPEVVTPPPTTPEEPEKPGTTDKPTTVTKSSEARLSNLGIKPNDFKGFKRNTKTYEIEVPHDVSEVNVYAEAVHSKATIKGTGKVQLEEGVNTVNVEVTAEDGTTKETYTLKITRLAEETVNNTEARLKNLGIKPEKYDFSGFKRDTTKYSFEVPNELEKIEVYADAISENAKVTGTGTVSLKEGLNTIQVEVTAEDGKTTKTYTLEITRKTAEEEPDDETEENPEDVVTEEIFGLAGLIVKDLNISPKFDVDTYEYTIGLTKDVSSLEIEAKANSEDTTVEIIGNENLQQGENIITILVKNNKTDEVATYQIIVNKNVKEEIVAQTSWLKPSTWGKEEKIIIAIIIVLIILIITAVVMKIRLSKDEEYDDEMDLPGGDELDRALAEHQELTEEENYEEEMQYEDEEYSEDNYIADIARKKSQESYHNIQSTLNTDVEEKADIEKAQEYFEEYSKRKGRHF